MPPSLITRSAVNIINYLIFRFNFISIANKIFFFLFVSGKSLPLLLSVHRSYFRQKCFCHLSQRNHFCCHPKQNLLPPKPSEIAFVQRLIFFNSNVRDFVESNCEVRKRRKIISRELLFFYFSLYKQNSRQFNLVQLFSGSWFKKFI